MFTTLARMFSNSELTSYSSTSLGIQKPPKVTDERWVNLEVGRRWVLLLSHTDVWIPTSNKCKYDTIFKSFWLAYLAKWAEIPKADDADHRLICQISSPIQRGRRPYDLWCTTRFIPNIWKRGSSWYQNRRINMQVNWREETNYGHAPRDRKSVGFSKSWIIFQILTNDFTDGSILTNKKG
jgi:hypothetical protein